jgi:hypothetical protein
MENNELFSKSCTRSVKCALRQDRKSVFWKSNARPVAGLERFQRISRHGQVAFENYQGGYRREAVEENPDSAVRLA